MTTEPGFRSRCEQLVATLPIPRPLEVNQFLAALAQQRGRRIELIPTILPATLPCGMLISTDDVDYIFHAIDTTPLHAQHIDMHEVGHLLLDHSAVISSVGATAHVPALAEQAAVRSLLPDISPELIRRILGRTVYTDVHEREAELFASLLLSRARHRGVPPRADSADFADHLARLRSPRPRPAGGSCAA